MTPYDAWNKALKNTEIVRPRVQSLATFGDTPLPYILLSESAINLGDTVVRSGEVLVEKPALFLPPNIPQFDGFEFEALGKDSEQAFLNFLFVRGVHMPSMKYSNHPHATDVYEGKLSDAIKHYREQLQTAENVHSGLIAAPDDCWQFALLLYVCSQIARNADTDIRRILDDFRKKKT